MKTLFQLRKLRQIIFVILGAFSQYTLANDWEIGGHFKVSSLQTSYPENSYYKLSRGDSNSEFFADYRLHLATGFQFKKQQYWNFNLDYQVSSMHSDTPGLASPLEYKGISDDTRMLNLSHAIREGESLTLVHRLDRFNLAYIGEKTVVRFGRQALSWGNGLILNVMDMVNPFDPKAFDQEYKTGDDMLYFQYLQDNGFDLQFAQVWRRDPFTENLDRDRGTAATKYHFSLSGFEMDVFLGEHYDDFVMALGGSVSLGGAILHSDISVTKSQGKRYSSGLLGLSYSWSFLNKNFSGVIEFGHYDWGMEENFSFSDVSNNAALFSRLTRGETFLLGKEYVAVSTIIELSPLFIGGLNLFANIDDGSALIQLSSTYDWRENLQLFTAVSLPQGKNGTEFGGASIVDSGNSYYYLSSEYQLLAKLSWYY